MRHMSIVFAGLLLSVLIVVPAFAEGEAIYAKCKGCHGVDGAQKAMGMSPALQGQSAQQLLEKLEGYVDGTYGGSKKMIMVNTLKRLSPEQLREVAEYIAGLGG